MASLAKMRAERLDAIITSLRAGKGTRGKLGALRRWPWRSIHLESGEGELWTEGGRLEYRRGKKSNDSLSSSGCSLIVLNTCLASSDTPIKVWHRLCSEA